ncbi:MAG: S1C family serine protease [Caulobacteraceae bacterium]
MKRNPLYSGSAWSRPPRGAGRAAETPVAEAPAPAPPKPSRHKAALAWIGRHRWAASSAALGIALAAVLGVQVLHPPRTLTQADVDAAVDYALKHRPTPPSDTSIAAEIIRPSVVRVVGYLPEDHPPVPAPVAPGAGKAPADKTAPAANEPPPQGAKPRQEELEKGAISVGSGVVIDEKGTILTNWHVADSAPRLKVTFSNGMVADADVVGAQPQDDLAVIRARHVPDDLKPATLVSTGGLRPGDQVVATGFPFAIGPSVSAGVVSGLKREWDFPDGRKMTNLIQFDAAANPGNSGGPLVNRKGEVLGVVTGILNPTQQHVFIGIGFAVPIENAAAAAGMSPF